MAADIIQVFAPATVANLGPGFDCLAVALEAPGDTVTARRVSTPGARLLGVRGDQPELPPVSPENTAAVAARLLLELAGARFGVELELDKGLPLGSGLGSSGASAVAAACAVNRLLDEPLPLAALVPVCARAEAAACGEAIADNVAAALLGGIALVRAPTEVLRLRTCLDLHLAVVSPRQRLDTRRVRAALPATVPLAEVVRHAVQLASLVHALTVGDADLLARALVDRLIEPCRAALIPGFPAAQRAALAAGALGSSISGAGPAVFALALGRAAARASGAAMQAAFEAETGARPALWLSGVAAPGAREVTG
jgi:homoserine kinase